MNSASRYQQRRLVVWLLLILFCAGTGGLVLPEAAESRVSDGTFVATDWVRQYRGPHSENWIKAMTVDGQGNVYVTGISLLAPGYTMDYLTLKYSPNGQLLWSRVYNSPEDITDQAEALAVDGQGNVYVTGASGFSTREGDIINWGIHTIKYSPDGEELWVRRYEKNGVNEHASAIALDSQGNIYITGSVTIKYSPDGQKLWVRDFSHGKAIAVDGQNNVCVTGHASNAETGSDYITIKYSSDGQKFWKRRYNGPGNGNDYPSAMALDSQGNIYITGSSVASGTGSNSILIKYSPDGRRLWVRRIGGKVMAVDRQDNVYIMRSIYNNDSYSGIISKYSPDGAKLWARRFNSYAETMSVDDSGNVYVSGTATIKYGPDGQKLWVRKLMNDAVVKVMAVDGQGNVFVGGDFYVSDYLTDYLIIKYRQNP